MFNPMLVADATAVHVYIDRKTPGGVPFYVGKGTTYRVKRAERNNQWHRNTRKKYPEWTREVIETASESLCNELEVFLIAEIGRRDLGLGPLVNLTNGGEGASGAIRSPATLAKLSASKKGTQAGEKHPMFGKKHGTEARLKMSAAQVGRVFSPELRAKMSAAHKGVPKTQEHRAAIARASLGKPGTTTGRKLSAEHRAKISAGGRAYRERLRAELGKC